MMIDNITIEEISENDYEQVAIIYNEYILSGNITMDEQIYDAQKIKGWVDNFNEREKLYVLKSNQNEVLGWGIIKKYSERAGYKLTCETAVYLAKDETGKGYGTLVKKYLISECKRLGYHHLVA